MQSLWIGRRLSVMERLSIASFLACGHKYHLYVYHPVMNVPEGVVFKAADEILPEVSIFQYKNYPSYAGFANFFRYNLLLQRGGWWVDTDFVCLKHFVFQESYVFASERVDGRDLPTNSVIKAPRGSEIMAFNCEVCKSCPDPRGVPWGEYGPKLMAMAIARYRMELFVKSPSVFCPIPFDRWDAALRPADKSVFGENTYAVHLWNEMWRRAALNKDARYAPGCLYEQFKDTFLSRCSRGLWGAFLSRCTKGLWRVGRGCKIN